MSRIVVFGGLNMDLMVEIPVPAGPGETRIGTRFSTTPGGKGGNQAVAAARLLNGSGTVEMIGRVGADRFGEEMIDALSSSGVGIEGVTVDGSTTTGIATIFIDAQGENYVNAVYGANAVRRIPRVAHYPIAAGPASRSRGTRGDEVSEEDAIAARIFRAVNKV